MFVKNLWRGFMVLSLVLGSMLNIKPAHALGSPQIIGISPGSGPAGTRVTIRVKVDWDSEYRAMRICFPDRNNCQESSEVEFERGFGTDGWGAGSYTIRVEVARIGDNDWANPNVTEASYQVTESQPAPEPTNPPQQSISCSADSFDVWPRTATVGDTVHISGSGSCNVNVRATKVNLDGNNLYEIGSPSLEWDWNTSGFSAGQHTLKLWVAGQGDNNWDYADDSSNITVQLNAPGQPVPPPDTSIPFDNCGVIGLNDGRIFVVTTYGDFEKHHVPNPETLNALGIPRAWIDNKGWSNSDLKSIHEGSDIPDANRDPSGFANFKSLCFPNTTPIENGGEDNQYIPNIPDGLTIQEIPNGPQGQIGDCPASDALLKPGDVAVLAKTDLNQRVSPDYNSEVMDPPIPGNSTITIVGDPVCDKGVRWYQVTYNGRMGWSAEVGTKGEYHIYPANPAEDNQESVPATQVPQSGSDTGNSESNPLSEIPASCQKLAEQNQTTGEKIMDFLDKITGGSGFSISADEQCTIFVNKSITEIETCWGKNHYPSGGFYDDWARDPNKSGACGWTVSPSAQDGTVDFSSAQPGDIVTWDPGSENGNTSCAGANYDHGHVAVYQGTNSDGTIRVTESNWTRDHNKVPVDPGCMNIIHLPSTGEQSETLQPQEQPTDKCSQYKWWDPRGWLCKIRSK